MEIEPRIEAKNLTDKVILFCLEQKLVVFLLVLVILGWGMVVAPFDWKIEGLPEIRSR